MVVNAVGRCRSAWRFSDAGIAGVGYTLQHSATAYRQAGMVWANDARCACHPALPGNAFSGAIATAQWRRAGAFVGRRTGVGLTARTRSESLP